MIEDAELLRRYAMNRNEADFAEVVGRHVNLVYSAALRQVNGDAHLAQDVTQVVFTDLARKAARLAQHRVIAGWLFTSTRFAAAKAVRGEQRRHGRELEAQRMHDILHEESGDLPDWSQVRPVLDEVLAELNEPDREAILLRYFEGRDYAAVGERLNLNPNTARMRVERAIDRLRTLLARRGVTSTSAALATVLAEQAVLAAPVGVAATVTGVALAGSGVLAGATMGTAGAATAINFMGMTKIQLGLTGAIAAAGAAGFVAQADDGNQLRIELGELRRTQIETTGIPQENARLAALVAEVDQLRRDDAELKRLRDETGLLRTRIQNAAEAATRRNLAASTYDISQLDQIPQAQFRVPPQYPLEMRQAGTSGEVVVEFIVDPNGNVRNATAIKSTRGEFEQAAVDAVKAWTFRPGMKNTRQVFTRMQVPIVFTLSPGPQLGTPLPKSNDQAAPASLNWF